MGHINHDKGWHEFINIYNPILKPAAQPPRGRQHLVMWWSEVFLILPVLFRRGGSIVVRHTILMWAARGWFPAAHMKRKVECILLYYFLFTASVSQVIDQSRIHVLFAYVIMHVKKTSQYLKRAGHWVQVADLSIYLSHNIYWIIRDKYTNWSTEGLPMLKYQ